MIFTTIPIPKQQAAPDTFHSRKIADQAPSAVSDSRISIVSIRMDMRATLFLQYLWAFVAAKMLSVTVPITAICNGLASPVPDLSFFPVPSLIISFREYNETIRNLLGEIGFTLQSSGRYKYARGPASEENIRKLVAAGAQTDAYALSGSCNVKGFLAYTIFTRLLNAALGYLVLGPESMPEMWKLSEVKDDLWTQSYCVTNAGSLPSNGILFPYFPGMVLPDKATTPRIILALFSRCLGKAKNDLTVAIATIQEGWPSLSTTPTGLIISHIVFGLHLAVTGSARLHPVVIGGTYQGFILSGTHFTVLQGGVRHSCLDKKALVEEFVSLDEHDEALLSIAEVVSSAPNFLDGKTTVVLPEHLSSARRIHYALRLRSFDNQQQATIARLLLKLHFRQTFWEKSDNGRIAAAVGTFLQGEWLPADAPYCIQSGSIFSRDPILSALFAFGDRAPSLCGLGNNTTITLNKSKKFYEGLPGKVKLEGIPFFFKPVITARDDWEQVIKTGLVTMKTGAADKKGFTRLAGLGTVVSTSSPEYARVCDLLATYVAAKIGKRKGREFTTDGDGLSKEPDAKKLREKERAGLGLLGVLNQGPDLAMQGEDPVMEDDASMDLFA